MSNHPPAKTPAVSTTVLGYPRIGRRRELKSAVESYWAGRIGAAELDEAGRDLRSAAWTAMREAGIAHIPSNTFSYYDHVLDTALILGASPQRLPSPYGHGRTVTHDGYFALARGTEQQPPLEMTKWFDTNYHYLVPEVGPDTRFALSWDKPLREWREAQQLGIETRPVLVGPLSLLMLAKPEDGAPESFTPMQRLDSVVEAYAELLGELAQAGVAWVQLDEPILAPDRTPAELEALSRAYQRLGALTRRPKLLVQTYFAEIGDALPALARTPVEGIGLDFVADGGAAGQGPGGVQLDRLAGIGGVPEKTLVAGVVDGRNVWAADLDAARATCATLLGLAGELVISSSCSLLHLPLDASEETALDPALRARLAFARQKLDEVALLGRALREGEHGVEEQLAAHRAAAAGAPADAVNEQVRRRLEEDGTAARRTEYAQRVQQRQQGADGLPVLPTTTIGSFPQTAEVRKARADHRAGRITDTEYENAMKAEIDSVISLQEDIGLDVLVHGEPERNDMVQYFAERLAGFATTEHGWVQSYGTRCVRPPILYGDVSRPEPITVGWTRYAQSRTERPVKGMLTGPVTMLAWSFVRDDQPRAVSARQVALALRDEIGDLESEGISHIQVDEAALREKLPLRRERQRDYLDWATAAFRLATSGVGDATQIHTHMCYSEFGEIIDAIGQLDADVTSVEAARSRMELVSDLGRAGYRRGIGPGVYDIHSPRVPTVDEIERSLRLALREVDTPRLWANPDCGLKTRGYPEVEPALRNMVEAVRRVRGSMQ